MLFKKMFLSLMMMFLIEGLGSAAESDDDRMDLSSNQNGTFWGLPSKNLAFQKFYNTPFTTEFEVGLQPTQGTFNILLRNIPASTKEKLKIPENTINVFGFEDREAFCDAVKNTFLLKLAEKTQIFSPRVVPTTHSIGNVLPYCHATPHDDMETILKTLMSWAGKHQIYLAINCMKNTGKEKQPVYSRISAIEVTLTSSPNIKHDLPLLLSAFSSIDEYIRQFYLHFLAETGLSPLIYAHNKAKKTKKDSM